MVGHGIESLEAGMTFFGLTTHEHDVRVNRHKKAYSVGGLQYREGSCGVKYVGKD